jgi:hypothetical protein
MSTQGRKAYQERVFSHSFQGFMGVRDTQAALWPDHRYVPELLNFSSLDMTISRRGGAEVWIRPDAGVNGHGIDKASKIFCVGGTVLCMEVRDLFAGEGYFSDLQAAFFSDVAPMKIPGSDVHPMYFSDLVPVSFRDEGAYEFYD